MATYSDFQATVGDPRGLTVPGPRFDVDLGAGRKKPDTWLDERHPVYRLNAEKWMFAADHYTGDVLDSQRIRYYLQQRALGETDESYEERVRLADFTPHFGRLSDALCGMLFQVEADANRSFGELDREGDQKGLGRPADPNSVIGQLWRDADGDGNGWLTLFKQLAGELVVNNMGWVFVDGRDGEPVVQVINPLRVINWRHQDGVLKEALLDIRADSYASIKQSKSSARFEKQYLYMSVDGWERWRKIKRDDGTFAAVPVVDADGNPVGGAWSFEDIRGNATIPLYQVTLPLKRPVGYIMARKSNAIFNKESERDHLLRIANFPILNVMGGDDVYDAVVDALRNGARVLKNKEGETPHTFAAPDTGPAAVASEVLVRKVDEFYVTGFKEYGDAARERTATEVRQDVNSGVAAFLQMLKSAVDDAENQALYRLEQQQFSTDRNKWGQARVERSDEFLPFDVDGVIDRLRTRYFGESKTIPVGPRGQLHVAREIAEYDGVPFDEDEARTAIAVHNLNTVLASMLQLPIPAEAQAKHAVDVLVMTGVVSADDVVEMDDGSERPMVEFLKEQALKIAMRDQEKSAREAEVFPAAPGITEQDDLRDDDESGDAA